MSKRPALTAMLRALLFAELERRQLSQAEFAERSGVPAPTLNRFLQNTRALRTETLDKIAAALGVVGLKMDDDR
jgi:transcriptional regulator with XRE-family HTH domain